MMNVFVKPDAKGIPTLHVHERPFLIRGGEIHNSSASDPEYMRTHVWPQVADMHLNTLIVPIYWELIEPEEGVYQFDSIDVLIRQARENDMKLVFLWFGLWKNAESTYIPGWMKKDSQTYFRVKTITGEPLNIISPFCQQAVEKDALAFSAVMSHIGGMDAEEATVLMMQVENEIGILGSDCDYCEAAIAAYAEGMPGELADLHAATGSWEQCFGDAAREMFMACQYAKAVETITSAGQACYPLPCYANAWLKQHPWYPGSYPSGGPVRDVHDVWKRMAPSLFTLAPDIYVPYVADVMEAYSYEGNPLFIPEIRKDAVTASYCLHAFGGHNAIGYAPFGIEDLALPADALEKPPMELMIALNIDVSAFDTTGSREYLKCTYGLLEALEPLYLQYRGTPQLQSWLKARDTDFGTFLHFDHYDISVSYQPKAAAKPVAAGIILQLAPNRFLIAGMMSTLAFRSKSGDARKTDILRMEEGTLEHGEWHPGRVLNGDEKMRLRLGDMPKCLMVELFQYV